MMKDYQAYIMMWNKRCSLRGLWAALLSGFMTLIQNAAAYIILIGILLNGSISVGEFVFYFGLVSGENLRKDYVIRLWYCRIAECR